MNEQVTEPEEEEVLRRMRLAEGVYFLSPHERPINVLYQQRRALNLAWALATVHSEETGHTVGVVGGGVAGLTCAAYLGRTGFRVTLFEKSRRLLPMFAESIRYLHPRIYDWPKPGFLEPSSDLPLMNWRSGLACDVAEDLVKEFAGWSDACGIRVRLGSRATQGPTQDGAPALSVSDRRGVRAHRFDSIILAPGFGHESLEQPDFDNHNCVSLPWWRLHGTYLEQLREAKLDIVGTGDGGLSDLIESVGVSQPMLGSPEWMAALRNEALLAIAEEIQEWIKREQARENDEFYTQLEEQYERFSADSGQIDRLLERAIASAVPEGAESFERVVYGHKPRLLTHRTYPLNRFIVSRIQLARRQQVRLRYVQNGVKSRSGNTRLFLRPGPLFRFTKGNEPDFAHWAEELAKLGGGGPADDASLAKPRWSGSSKITRRQSMLRPGMRTPELRVMSTFYNPESQRRAVDRLAPKDFRRVFLGRLRRDILMFGKVVLTDAQLLDGVYFRRHLHELLSLSDFFEVAARGVHANANGAEVLERVLDAFVSRTSGQGARARRAGRRMCFWSLPEGIRGKVETGLPVLTEEELKLGPEAALGSVAPGDPEVQQLCKDWAGMLETVSSWALLEKKSTATDQRTNTFADLGALCRRLRTAEARVLAAEIWRAPGETPRNTFDPRIDALDAADAEAVRMWMYQGYDAVLARDYGLPAFSTLWVSPLDELSPDGDGLPQPMLDCMTLGSLTEDEFEEVRTELAASLLQWREGQVGWEDVWRTWRGLPLRRPGDVAEVKSADDWGRRCSSWMDPRATLEAWNVPDTRNDPGSSSPAVLLIERADGRTSSITTVSRSLWGQPQRSAGRP